MKQETPSRLLAAFAFLIVVTFNSCKKIVEENSLPSEEDNTSIFERNPDTNCDLSTTICEDCATQTQIDNDTAAQATVLGGYYNNPYSISNMTASYNYIYSQNLPSLAATHRYVRFKPASASDLNVLDSLGVQLYDYPLSRNVIKEGDYWPEAYTGLQENEFPWLYSVVEDSFIPPAGMTYQVLENLHIPDDNEALEDEAFYRTNNSVCDSVQYKMLRAERKNYYLLLPVEELPCEVIDIDCNGNGGGPGGTGSAALKPKGQINFKTYNPLVHARLGADAPLKYVRVVGRRFFKIDKTYTDASGNFSFSKRFPRKVTIIVKFKSSTGSGQHYVRSQVTNLGVWRAMFPLKKNIGTYKGNSLQNLNYEFQKGSTTDQTSTRKWVAAVAFNTAQESRDFLSENGMLQLPDDIRIYLYNNGTQENLAQYDFLRRSNAPLLNQNRWIVSDILTYGVASIFYSSVVALMASGAGVPVALFVAAFVKFPQYPDVYLSFRTSDINSLTASKLSISVAQQLAIAYLNRIDKESNADGPGWQEYFDSMGYVDPRYSYDNYKPFGPGNDNNSLYFPGTVAIWQCFAQHFGHTISDRIYGTGASSFELQGKQWTSDILGGSSSRKYLEGFDPSIPAPQDHFSWIPVGLITDLMDNSSEPPFSYVTDNVSGFSYANIQYALYQKPANMQALKNILKTLRPSQSAALDNLFTSYGY